MSAPKAGPTPGPWAYVAEFTLHWLLLMLIFMAAAAFVYWDLASFWPGNWHPASRLLACWFSAAGSFAIVMLQQELGVLPMTVREIRAAIAKAVQP